MTLPNAQGCEPTATARAAPAPRVFVGIKVAPEIAAQLAAFAIGLKRPFAQPRRPRFLWSVCAAGEEIIALHAALLDAFGQTKERAFQPHVTLARIRGGPTVAPKHPIDQELELRQRVESVELFQSPPPGNHGYKVLASLPLGEAAASGPEQTHRA